MCANRAPREPQGLDRLPEWVIGWTVAVVTVLGLIVVFGWVGR